MPGQVISYTLTITNTGQTTYTGAVVTDSFAAMFDDAAYNGDAATTGTGALTYTSPALTWTGDLPAGAAAVITYTVTVNNPDTGDKLVITTVSLGRGRVVLPARHHQRRLPGHRPGADPRPDHHQHRQPRPPPPPALPSPTP